MGDDKWTKKAFRDDSIVVALLLQIKQQHKSPPSSTLPPLRWGQRQLRSKASSSKDRYTSTTRCSPTTPLSWSDGCDTSATRSKGTCAYEARTSGACKKSRKKKTFSELREEESYLMNERMHLEKLASVNVTLNEQRYRGDNLKRIKLDFQGPTTNEMLAPMPGMFFHCRQTKASLDIQNNLIFPRQAINNDPESSSSCKVAKDNESGERCFILPDLNMMPSEDPGC
ncbi:uncharacterized protein LOC141672188 isoform X2 [Apium graveolens]|uniref:uncharacterized protein LOC141672188 isoform X2 n=1 Tax=Apium graveolens TaxID=4045 RepID=UPI003D7AC962